MGAGASFTKTLGRWFEAFGSTNDRAVGGLIDAGATGERHGPPTCDLCGRRLLLGESLNHFRKDDGVVAACPVCEPEALLVGYVRLPTESDPSRWYRREGQVARVERPAAAIGGLLEPEDVPRGDEGRERPLKAVA